MNTTEMSPAEFKKCSQMAIFLLNENIDGYNKTVQLNRKQNGGKGHPFCFHVCTHLDL